MRPATVAAGLLAGLLSTATAAAGPRLGGYLSSSVAVRTEACAEKPSTCGVLELKEAAVVGLTIAQDLGPGGAAKAAVEARYLHLRELDDLEQTSDVAAVSPLSFRIAEARLDLYDLLPRTDLAVGMLRLPWGQADGVNPSDRLNPFNLEDPTRFDRRLASPAMVLAHHPTPSLRLELVALPLFVPAALSVEEVDLTSADDADMPFSLAQYMHQGDQPPEVRAVQSRPSLPELTVGEQVSGALRAIWDGPLGTFTFGALAGRDSLPQISGQVWISGLQTAHAVDVAVGTRYPRLYMLSAGWRGELGWRMTGWVETAVIRPSRTVVTVSAAQMASLVRLGRIARAPDPGAYTEIQPSAPYVQGVAGVDRRFGGGLYLNLQLVRGLPLERTPDDQRLYLTAALRYPLLAERLELQLLGMGALDDPEGAAGLGRFGVRYLHGDSVELGLSLVQLGGAEGTALSRFSELGHVRLDLGARF